MRASSILALRALAAILLALLAVPAPAQQQQNHIAAELVVSAPPKSGETVDIALRFRPEPGWHGYWSNPGDAGYGMTLDWSLPAGWQAGEPQYPVPHRLVIAGLMNHVYEGEYAVIVPIAVPEGAAVSGTAPLQVEANWLACTDEICVPEQATLSATWPNAVDAGTAQRFDRWHAALPPLLDSMASFAIADGKLRIAIPLPASLVLEKPHVFLSNEEVIDYAAPQAFRRDGDLLAAEIPLRANPKAAEQVSGVLSLDAAGNGVTFAANPGEVPTGGTLVAGEGNAGMLAPLWLLLGGAFLGGLILNIMPCVFPILSLKALSLARAGESQRQARREGLAYTAGVMLAVLALGALMLVLRAAGNEIGWAFQLQEPGVVVALLILAAAITANLAGLFELPSISVTRSGEPAGAFATGILAAFVATPCTGPFMAAAMGAALLLPWWQGLLLFGALGLGLALPFLLLGFVPPLRRMLPRPGKWMDTFRKVMAVPMGLTALALVWLAWRQGGVGFAISGLILSIAAVQLFMYWRRGFVPVAIRAAVIVGMVAVILPQTYEPRAQSRATAGIIAAQPFNEAALAEARASGQPVFVWFTADWCLTCKVNEGV
ncbi:MAG TPA: protein-disulfide reductase DsbD domain-containing protein, partial [Alteraurantiacibacter sp.]